MSCDKLWARLFLTSGTSLDAASCICIILCIAGAESGVGQIVKWCASLGNANLASSVVGWSDSGSMIDAFDGCHFPK